MALTLRTIKGSELTHEEGDENLRNILYSEANLQTFITNNRYVRLGEGTWNVNNLTIPTGTIIKGIPGKTIFEVTEGNTGITATNADIVLDGITLNALSGTVTAISDIAGLKAKTGMGNTVGMVLSGNNGRQVIRNCRFNGFNKSGLEVATAGATYQNGLKISDCFFTNNYHGLWIKSGAEYSNFSNITAYNNQIGVEVDAGNSLLTMIHADGNNVGVYVSGYNVTNDSHGSLSTSTFNHSGLKGVVIMDITNGFHFANCQMFAAAMHIENSKGFAFTGGTIAGGVNVVGTVGMTAIHNCMFATGSGSGNITGGGSISLKNNYWTTGADNTGINNAT
jgi:hypothetical protein